MTQLRALIRRHRHLAIALLVLAFCFKIVVPAGMMVSSAPDRLLTVTICTGGVDRIETVDILVPGSPDHGPAHPDGSAKAEHCAFAGLAKAALGGAGPILLAAAFAFILVLGLAPSRIAPLARIPYLRPPLRAPPAQA
ncbi:DUF2946 family protein [Pelagerythrobacter marensis]|uniref:DUF2946 family protein n=1 Tax=Pelagerythrobacter marensis TaxID=543877 RepID=A0ABZ2D8N4_9SPHN